MRKRGWAQLYPHAFTCASHRMEANQHLLTIRLVWACTVTGTCTTSLPTRVMYWGGGALPPTSFNPLSVSLGSPSPAGDVMVYVCVINEPSLPTPFYSVLVSVPVFVALSTVFHSINSPDNSPFSHFVVPFLPLPY